jgi:hypothetical protein
MQKVRAILARSRLINLKESKVILARKEHRRAAKAGRTNPRIRINYQEPERREPQELVLQL